MKGIVLAGGSGTRLYPLTRGVSKQLLPIYDKPMVFYSISTLMLAGIKDILIITTPEDNAGFKRLLGDGSDFGINLEYAIQPSPDGLAQAFIIGEGFIGDDSVCLVLGDNIFYGQSFSKTLKSAASRESGATVFGYQVKDPERFGVVAFDENKRATCLEEKPENPKSNLAIPGLYFFDHTVVEKAKQVKPSARGELEITDIHNAYWKEDSLRVAILEQCTTWLDTGTVQSLSKAHAFVEAIQIRQGVLVGSPELAAYKQGFINLPQLKALASTYKEAEYGKCLKQWIDEQ